MDGDTKACPVCGESIKAAALKCRFCNTDLGEFASAKELETERALFVGRPALIYSVGQFFPFVVVAGMAMVTGYLREDIGITMGQMLMAFTVLWGLILLRLYLKRLARHYEITTQRIKLERGWLSKVQESLELFRIDHFELHKPFGMRLLGYSELHLFSSDAELKNFFIYGVEDIEMLADTLRTCQLRERTRRGLMTVVKA